MKTFSEMHAELNSAGRPNSYWGDRGDWLVAGGISRDSELLEISNWESLLELLRGSGFVEGGHWTIERENHWACGWVEHLLINPESAGAISVCAEAAKRLEDYPVLDEEDFSQREWEAELKTAEQELSSLYGDRWKKAYLSARSYKRGKSDDMWRIIEELVERSTAREDRRQARAAYRNHWRRLATANCLGVVISMPRHIIA